MPPPPVPNLDGRGAPLCALDLDGTLVDSAADIHLHLNTALGAVGHPTLTLAQAVPLIGHGARNLVDRAMPGAPPSQRERALAHLKDAYGAAPVVHTTLHAGAVGLLEQLRQRGVRTAVVTNKPHPLAVAVLQALGVMHLLDSVHGGLPEVPLKPAPDLLLHAVRDTHADPARVVLVGDSTVDLDTAVATGCVFVGVALGVDGGAGLRARGVALSSTLQHAGTAVLAALGVAS